MYIHIIACAAVHVNLCCKVSTQWYDEVNQIKYKAGVKDCLVQPGYPTMTSGDTADN